MSLNSIVFVVAAAVVADFSIDFIDYSKCLFLEKHNIWMNFQALLPNMPTL